MGLSISVFGMGYVGSVTAACFAHVGHKVIGVDVSPAKVEMMASGRSPIIEARMSELVEAGHRAGLLHATTNAEEAVRDSEISFVCVGTPSLRSGKFDLGYVERVVREIGAALKTERFVSCDRVAQYGSAGHDGVAGHPDLREGQRTPRRARILRSATTRNSCAKEARWLIFCSLPTPCSARRIRNICTVVQQTV